MNFFLKLPNFWHKQPKLWFAQLESEFTIFRIRSSDVKYSSVARHLMSKPGMELNDKKPSKFLRKIKQLEGGVISENILHSIWLQRLPFQVQATLTVIEDCPLIKLAELADKIMDCEISLQVASIASVKENASNLADLERRIAALEIKRPRSRFKFRYKEDLDYCQEVK
ncbi:hypothetical protein ACFW04_013620 [Cataglyphis niger]